MNFFKLRILTAERAYFDGDCESLVIPTLTGQVGIQAGHSPMIASVIPGMLLYREHGGNELLPVAVSHGICKCEGNEVTILVDSALGHNEIDPHRAKAAAEKAREDLAHQSSMREYYSAKADLARAMGRLRVSSKKPVPKR